MRFPHRGETGFTLAELLVVIVILGVLAAVAIPIFLNQADRAEQAALEADMASALSLLNAGQAIGATLPSSMPANTVTVIPGVGGIEPGSTLTVSGSGDTLCVEGMTGSGDTYSANLSEGLRNYDCDGNLNGIEPLVLSYPDTTFTLGSDAEMLSSAVSGGVDGKTYSISGDPLPRGVTFDSATGSFTGPNQSEWNFTATQVSVGTTHTCALTESGGVKCWGANTSGQLGDGTTTDRYTPTNVLGLSSGVVDIDAGGNASCAVTNQGAVKCWGVGYLVGDGVGTSNRSTPTDVVGLSTGVTQVVVGHNSACVLTTPGGVKCWGANHYGQVGDGTSTHRVAPVDVIGLSSGVTVLDVGYWRGCVVTDQGGAKCWGRSAGGSTPKDVNGLTSGVIDVAAGSDLGCAVTYQGGVKCWGGNNSGQLGDGSTTDSYDLPVDVVGLSSGVASVEIGGDHVCAITVTGGGKCWGSNWLAQLGDGTRTDQHTPVDLYGFTSGLADVSLQGYHQCALSMSGHVKCWGYDSNGQRGTGKRSFSSTATNARAAPEGFPADVDVTVTDESGSTTKTIQLNWSL